ncbi:hypothetical protein [Streptomyces sp. NPDC088752]|uniref:hypothetical protein n=1 Tax=Streptomyces sp. NPDC088752 TaxID=3154963 RepID=UPI00341990E7
MTVPEENRPKTTSTDETIEAPDVQNGEERDEGATGRTLREAMEEAGLRPDDIQGDA